MSLDEDREPTFQPCFFMLYSYELDAEPYNEQPEEQGLEWHSYKDDGLSSTPREWAGDIYEYFLDYKAAHYFGVKKNGGPELPYIKTFQYAFPLLATIRRRLLGC